MSSSTRPRLVLPYPGFGPYHLARWRHLRDVAPSRGWDVVAVELLGRQDRYRWDADVDGREDGIVRFAFPSDGNDQVRWRDAPALLRRLSSLEPDVVAVNGWALRDSVVMHAWCRSRGVARIVVTDTTEADAPRSFVKEQVKRVILGGVGAAFAAGAASRRYVASLGVPPGRITEGCDVVDNAHFASARSSRRPHGDAPLRLLTVARLVPEKNLLAAADAFMSVVREGTVDATWTIAGYGPLEDELRQRQAGSDGRIRLLGAVRYADLPAVFAQADVFWLPSRSESWGLVVNEAMAAGLPVAVSDRAGCHEDLVTAATGWRVDPTSVATLTEGLRRVFAEQAEWVAKGTAAAATIAGWDVDRFSRGLLDTADLALGAGRRRR